MIAGVTTPDASHGETAAEAALLYAWHRIGAWSWARKTARVASSSHNTDSDGARHPNTLTTRDHVAPPVGCGRQSGPAPA